MYYKITYQEHEIIFYRNEEKIFGEQKFKCEYLEGISPFTYYHSHLAEIIIPIDAKIIKNKNIYYANKIILKNKYNLSILDDIKYLISLGLDKDCLIGYIFEHAYLDILKYFIFLGVDVTMINSCNAKLMIENGNLDFIKYLISQYANIADYLFVIECIFEYGCLEIIKYIIYLNINIWYDDIFRIEINYNCLHVIKYLNYLDINPKPCNSSHLHIIKYLICTIPEMNGYFDDCLWFSIYNGCLDIAKFLLIKEYKLNKTYSLCIDVIKNGNFESLKYLTFWNPELTNYSYRFHYSFVKEHLKILNYLVYLNVNIAKDNIFDLACKGKNLKAIKYIIATGIDISAKIIPNLESIKKCLKNIKYLSFLSFRLESIYICNGSAMDYESIIKYLLYLNIFNNSFFYYAIKHEYLEIIKHSIFSDIDINNNNRVFRLAANKPTIIKHLMAICNDINF